MQLIKGFASNVTTQVHTRGALGNVFESKRRPLYLGGPYVTSLGFGTYRVGFSKSLGFPECECALTLAIRKGINLIDTSTIYGNGQSEELIGKVIAKLILEEKIIGRENLVIVSKVGYMQGVDIEVAKDRILHGNPFPEISYFTEDLWHCIHPDFIFDQVERSRTRLGVETIDVYLLHNPEYMLKRLEIENIDEHKAREIFYFRLEESFRALEQLVREGKIKAYGVSSNSFAAPVEDKTFVSIARMHKIAHSINEDHSFKVIQLPMNWIEVSPALYEQEEMGESVLSYAQKHNIGVLVNRPFNAMFNDGLIRLTRPQISNEDSSHLNEEMHHKLDNWSQLAKDLETLAKEKLLDVPGYEEATLSQLVLSTLSSIPGVTSVLCGMRKEKYVEDAQAASSLPYLLHAKEHLKNIYENLEFNI